MRLRTTSAIALCACLAAATGVQAQTLGGPSRPAVEVDLGVLDELGGANRPGAVIPPGLFPSPRQSGAGAAFEPPQPAPQLSTAQPPTDVPVVRPASGPVIDSPPARQTAGVKDVRTVRPPAESVLTAGPGQAASQAAKEPGAVRQPADVALQASPGPVEQPAPEPADVPAPTAESQTSPAPQSASEQAPVAEQTAEVAPAESSAETTGQAPQQVASTEPVDPPSDQEASPQAPAVQLPELSIPSGSAATLLGEEDNGEVAQVQVEAIPAPAPRVLQQQPADETEGSDAPGDAPTVIDGIAVPDSETLDALEETADQETASGLPAVNVPQLAVREADEPAPEQTAPAADQGEVTRVQSTQVAAIPGFEDLRILFDGADSIVGPQGTALIMGLSQRLNRDESLRLQIRAYAGGTPEAATQARRLSLDRALAVRSMLIDQGIRGTRIDIRALGNSAPEEPRDRVDIIIQ